MKHLLSTALFSRFAIAFAFSILIIGAGSSAVSAQVTFAQFNQVSASNNFVFTNNTTSGTLSTVAGGVPVVFTYSNIAGLDASLQGPQDATLTITTGTTTQPANIIGTDIEQPFNQIVRIVVTRNTPAPVGAGTRDNLLTIVFQPNIASPSAFGPAGGSAATLSASTSNNIVLYSSHFVSFGATTDRNLALSFSSVDPSYSVGIGLFLQSFTAAGTGTFSSDTAPVIGGTTAANVSVGGRVLDPNGRGLGNTDVVLSYQDGTTRRTRTSSFGDFRFDDLNGGQSAVVAVKSRRFSYQPQVVPLSDNALQLTFMPSQ